MSADSQQSSGPMMERDALVSATENLRQSYKSRLKGALEAVQLNANLDLEYIATQAYAAGLKDGWNQGLDHAARTVAKTGERS